MRRLSEADARDYLQRHGIVSPKKIDEILGLIRRRVTGSGSRVQRRRASPSAMGILDGGCTSIESSRTPPRWKAVQ
jgi:hypothetical protein